MLLDTNIMNQSENCARHVTVLKVLKKENGAKKRSCRLRLMVAKSEKLICLLKFRKDWRNLICKRKKWESSLRVFVVQLGNLRLLCQSIGNVKMFDILLIKVA